MDPSFVRRLKPFDTLWLNCCFLLQLLSQPLQTLVHLHLCLLRLFVLLPAPGLLIQWRLITRLVCLFSPHHVCFSRDKVWIADGSYSSIASKLDIVGSPYFHFSSVLHVPNFSLNLCALVISLNHLTDCHFPSYYVFQDLEMKKMIGRGFEKHILYLLDIVSPIASSIQHVSML